jgi:predicted nucleic acid-binding protein
MIVIADSSPLRYLIVIEQVHLLPLLYGRIVIPSSVERELTRTATPQPVVTWMEHLPGWVTVKSPQNPQTALASILGLGEREAIALAEELAADVLLVDDEAARVEAVRRNIPVQGTLGLLDLAAEHGLLADLPGTIQRLQSTNFRASKKLYAFLLERDALRKKRGARGS